MSHDPKIAIALGPIKVYWYGIIIALGAACGLWLAIREGKRFKIPAVFFQDLLLFAVPSALIGARIYFVSFKWEEYRNNPLKIFYIWEGGIAIYGALIGSVICAVIYTRYHKRSFWKIADIAAPCLLAGQLIGRWGNFVNQEAYGGPVQEEFLRSTLHLPNFIVERMSILGEFHHPTFLYESFWNLIGLGIILILRRRSFVKQGELFFSYIIWYSFGRFFIEGLRTDSLAFHGGVWLEKVMDFLWSPMHLVFSEGYLSTLEGNIRISQLIAILLVVGAIAAIILRRFYSSNENYNNESVVEVRNANGTQG